MINLFDGKYLYRIFFLKKIFLVVFRKFKTKSLLTIFIFHNMKKPSFYNTYLYFEKKYCIYYKYFCVAEFIFKNKNFLYFISYKLKILRSL